MEEITLHGKMFKRFITATDIQRAISLMAEKMNADLADKSPLFLSVLNGAFMFSSDLIKQITIPQSQISFVKMVSYSGLHSSGEVQELIGLEENIKDRTVIILEDVVDSGHSMNHLLKYLQTRQPKEIYIASLFYKPRAMVHPITIHYKGIELNNDFVVGYGLDYDGLGRNYPDLYILNE